ncbi:MAG: DUF4321 domain-containing protein [Gemmatimonadota bacterium]|jgi:hypothetical protein|nr:DUF4321 domain-containing protein [Gemmatimonadota bacterium]MDP6802791.1 DUF4321 domain-containing protein [Gemmatimonadota bacterium]MDP7032728.1 DUF4321 domain-containing protein [Gemmatimonadota bacterium]
MTVRHRSPGILVFGIILGLLIGAIVGEAIGLILPDGVVKEFFLLSVGTSVGPATVNLVALSFTVGFTVKINLMAVLGVVFATYLLRWY